MICFSLSITTPILFILSTFARIKRRTPYPERNQPRVEQMENCCWVPSLRLPLQVNVLRNCYLLILMERIVNLPSLMLQVYNNDMITIKYSKITLSWLIIIRLLLILLEYNYYNNFNLTLIFTIFFSLHSP